MRASKTLCRTIPLNEHDVHERVAYFFTKDAAERCVEFERGRGWYEVRLDSPFGIFEDHLYRPPPG